MCTGELRIRVRHADVTLPISNNGNGTCKQSARCSAAVVDGAEHTSVVGGTRRMKLTSAWTSITSAEYSRCCLHCHMHITHIHTHLALSPVTSNSLSSMCAAEHSAQWNTSCVGVARTEPSLVNWRIHCHSSLHTHTCLMVMSHSVIGYIGPRSMGAHTRLGR